jgi:hypothetical protein
MREDGEIIPGGEPRSAELHLARAEQIAFWLDRRFLDPIVGVLFPGLGDLVSSALGLYVIALARQRRLHPVIIARMLVNLAVDALIGAVPIVGDVFDLFYRAHVRNLRLLRSRPPHERATAGDWLIVAGAGLLLVATLTLPVGILVLVGRRLLGWG